MGKGMQVVSGFVTAPSTTFTAWTMASGDSLSVRNCPDGAPIYLLNFWAQNQVIGQLRVRSPLLHDNVVGMTAQIVVAEQRPFFPLGAAQNLKAQDLLIVEQTGSAVGGQIESGSLLVYYTNLPGADARLVHWDQIKNNIESYMYSFQTITAGAGGGYTGSAAINAGVDQWKANRDYALLGYQVSVACCTVGWTGPDTSNLRVGGPGNPSDNTISIEWFKRMSLLTGMPTIPILNSANKAATTVDVVQSQAAAATRVTSVLALLR